MKRAASEVERSGGPTSPPGTDALCAYTCVDECVPHPVAIPASGFVFGLDGAWCDPLAVPGFSPPSTSWRERALRAAAVWPCTRRFVAVIDPYAGSRVHFLPSDGPICSLYVECLHPALQVAYVGRCAYFGAP